MVRYPYLHDKLATGFISQSAVANYPFIGFIAQMHGCIFVNRIDKNNTNASLQMLIEKQKAIYEGKDKTNFIIFSEGTTSNGTVLLQFKRGAFVSKLPMKPVIIKFDAINRISLALDVIEMLFHAFIVICELYHPVEMIYLPTFEPNEYLFNVYGKELKSKIDIKEDWQVYAYCLREIMSEESGLTQSEGNYEMKNEYLKFLRGNKTN